MQQSVSSSSVADLIPLLSVYNLIFVNFLSKTLKHEEKKTWGGLKIRVCEREKRRQRKSRLVHKGAARKSGPQKQHVATCLPPWSVWHQTASPCHSKQSPESCCFFLFIYPTSCSLACFCTFCSIVWLCFCQATICVSPSVSRQTDVCIFFYPKGLNLNCLHCP